MKLLRLRWMIALGAVAVLVALPAAGQAASTKASATSTTITVMAGKPSELAFKLSKFSKIPAGTVVFNVTNAGKIAHTFAICLTATAAAPNACVGKQKVTKLLQPGKSQTITVTLSATGTYEYLCTFPGHAAAGMKGLIGIGVPVTAAMEKAAQKSVSTTTTATTTTAAGGGGATTTTASGGGTTTSIPNDGCPAGVTIGTSGNTDNDQDENGQPSDNDGCI